MMGKKLSKSNYILFSKYKETFSTRLTTNDRSRDRFDEILHLGVWITEDLSWDRQISEICKRSYQRIKMINKPKYVGVPFQD